jgi:hypothetical protein
MCFGPTTSSDTLPAETTVFPALNPTGPAVWYKWHQRARNPAQSFHPIVAGRLVETAKHFVRSHHYMVALQKSNFVKNFELRAS